MNEREGRERKQRERQRETEREERDEGEREREEREREGGCWGNKRKILISLIDKRRLKMKTSQK